MTQNSINSINPIIQFVSTSSSAEVDCTTLIPRDDTIPQNTEGDEVITLTITPKYSTSKLLIDFIGTGATSTTNPPIALFQDSTADALSANGYRYGPTYGGMFYLRHIMTSGTTSSTTFKIRIGYNSGPVSPTVFINQDLSGTRVMGGVSRSIMTITEYYA